MAIKQKSYLYAFFALVEFAGGVYELIKDQYVIGIAFIVVAVAFTIMAVVLWVENRNTNKNS